MGNFLISPFKFYGDVWNIPQSSSDFPFLTICDLSKERGSQSRTKCFSQVEEFASFLASSDQKPVDSFNLKENGVSAHGLASDSTSMQHSNMTAQRCGRIVFLRGFPSAEWLNHIGAAFDVHPEFFYRHLDVSLGIVHNTDRPDYLYPTPFPLTQNIIKLRVCNTGTWNTSRSGLTLEKLRERCQESIQEHLDDFLRLRTFALGDSIVRKILLHDLHNFSIEQQISVQIIYHTKSWSSKSNTFLR